MEEDTHYVYFDQESYKVMENNQMLIGLHCLCRKI